ncbi:protein-methionine-sulfoxide reductase catalytic subunit MsrP [Ectothiorhodospiraceae bacterium BW-2]|nr:protein-methionine-sulfoxide reductase catalytic subunit MsrP [Ectothiorhodospiraceae bacterium BW-2]
MPIFPPEPLSSADITPESIYRERRRFLRTAAAGALMLSGASAVAAIDPKLFLNRPPSPLSSDEAPNSYEAITTYNNYYELGSSKSDPAERAHHLQPHPWSITIDGLVEQPAVFTIDDLLRNNTQEERIYRLRCVEGWSMVIPWIGFELGQLLQQVKPLSAANFVAFETLHDPEQLPGQKRPILRWPYREGLRLDEATHPLTILATGLYDKPMPSQNGAPIRLVVPWKYGFKSIKSIVKITLTEQQPPTSWNQQAPHEYGFYANVNPEVDHPRWSQRRERRIGEFFKRDTLPFNGYGEQVASLYRGMDLTRDY